MGVGMRINHSLGNQLVSGILHLLQQLGVWKGETGDGLIRQPLISIGQEVSFVNAEASGIFLTDIKNGIVVDEGEEIGNIVSPLTGQVLHRIVAPVHGYFFTIRAYPVVYEGSLIARIHKL